MKLILQIAAGVLLAQVAVVVFEVVVLNIFK
jgi:hypothetical protein